jgi:hypothetical protein
MKGHTFGSGAIMRVLRQSIASAAAALVATLMSLSVAYAQSASNTRNWDEVFAQVVGDQTDVWKQSDRRRGIVFTIKNTIEQKN